MELANLEIYSRFECHLLHNWVKKKQKSSEAQKESSGNGECCLRQMRKIKNGFNKKPANWLSWRKQEWHHKLWSKRGSAESVKQTLNLRESQAECTNEVLKTPQTENAYQLDSN